jgi:anti-sigma-K factor RskA
MSESGHTDIIALLPAYALSSLEGAEAALVAAHLDSCAACRAELNQYEAVVDLLPAAVPEVTPAAGLRDRVLAQAQASTATQPDPADLPTGWRKRWSQQWSQLLRSRWSPVLALAVLLLLAGAVFLWRQAQTPPARFELTSTEAAPQASGLIEAATDGRQATLSVSGLPPLSSDQQYQLWLIRDGQRASGAVFSVDADGWAKVPVEASRPLTDYAAFGITIEPAGGSPGPTGQRVLGYNL